MMFSRKTLRTPESKQLAQLVLEKKQHTSGFFVDQARNTLDTTTTSETANSGLGDSLDVITKNLTMALGTSFSEALTSLSTSRHDSEVVRSLINKLRRTQQIRELLYEPRGRREVSRAPKSAGWTRLSLVWRHSFGAKRPQASAHDGTPVSIPLRNLPNWNSNDRSPLQ